MDQFGDDPLPWEKEMTLCVGALCENKKTIVLVADRMFGLGFAEAELNIRKATQVHADWMVMIAGNDVAPAFDILEEIKTELAKKGGWALQEVITKTVEAYKHKRLNDAITLYLSPRGWKIDDFRSKGRELLGESLFEELDLKISSASLSVTLLVAGFDAQGNGHIFSVTDPGRHQRHDLNGFHAIGSGSFGAYYMMMWRELSTQMALEKALYHAQEAKIFGEQASGVGYKSDIYIMRRGHMTKLTRGGVSALDDIWFKLKPAELAPIQVKTIAKLQSVVRFRRAVTKQRRRSKRQAVSEVQSRPQSQKRTKRGS